jgi:hypothetical protein
MCRPKSVSLLRDSCPLLKKYYFTEGDGQHITYSRWRILMAELKGLDA